MTNQLFRVKNQIINLANVERFYYVDGKLTVYGVAVCEGVQKVCVVEGDEADELWSWLNSACLFGGQIGGRS